MKRFWNLFDICLGLITAASLVRAIAWLVLGRSPWDEFQERIKTLKSEY